MWRASSFENEPVYEYRLRHITESPTLSQQSAKVQYEVRHPEGTSLFPFLSGAFAKQLGSKQKISTARKKEDRCQL
jgi:hypothetical protein